MELPAPVISTVSSTAELRTLPIISITVGLVDLGLAMAVLLVGLPNSSGKQGTAHGVVVANAL